MKKLCRTKKDRILGGVCGGIARWLDIDPSIIRIIWALLTLFSYAFPGILLYILLWVILPEEDDGGEEGVFDAEYTVHED